jgi:hypothetical protein
MKTCAFAESHKACGELNGKSVEIAIDSCSDQTYVQEDLIKKTNINYKIKVASLCYYGAEHKCPTAQVIIELANNEGNTVKKELKVGIVPTLAVDVLLGGDFRNIENILALKATSMIKRVNAVTRSQEKNKREAVPPNNENDDQNIQNPFQFNDEIFIKNTKPRKLKSKRRADKKEYNQKQEKLSTVEKE